MKEQEVIHFQNKLGMITNKRIVLKSKSGEESILIGKISSIGYQHKRNLYGVAGSALGVLLILSFILSSGAKFNGIEALIVVGLVVVFILGGIANWVGRHYILISVDGKPIRPFKVVMADSKLGKELYLAIDRILS